MIKLKFLLLFLFVSLAVFSEVVEDSIEVRVDVKPYFSLTIETYMIPFIDVSDHDLFQPSRNVVVNKQDLEGVINLGHLIARKQAGEIMPLVSEYRVLMKIKCATNKNIPYTLTQNLEEPLTGIESGVLFPKSAFVSMAAIDSENGDTNTGQSYLQWETPVLPGEEIRIFKSSETDEYLGNEINVLYWISDQQEDKVTIEQRADKYKGTLVITMLEL